MPMSSLETESTSPKSRLTERERKRLRNAVARRKLELMREEKALKRWLVDVWDEQTHDR